MNTILKIKLNVLLAKTDHLAESFRASIADYVQFFKNKQSAFRGEKKTYDPKDGTVDFPNERGNTLVITTVSEKLGWLVDTNKEYIDAIFSQEATNASGSPRADLTVDGENLGNYSSLELLRLKSILENGTLTDMYSNIPVRDDDKEWADCSSEQYQGRQIFEGPLLSGVRKSVMKETFILQDPNIAKLQDSARYTPQVSQKDTIIELGDYTHQRFTGEWSHRQRAELLRRRTKLLNAVIEALKVANDCLSISSEMTAQKLFGYLHK